MKPENPPDEQQKVWNLIHHTISRSCHVHLMLTSWIRTYQPNFKTPVGSKSM